MFMCKHAKGQGTEHSTVMHQSFETPASHHWEMPREFTFTVCEMQWRAREKISEWTSRLSKELLWGTIFMLIKSSQSLALGDLNHIFFVSC